MSRTPNIKTGLMPRLAVSAVAVAMFQSTATLVHAADHLLCLSDLGTPLSPQPDGFADRIIWDDVQRRLRSSSIWGRMVSIGKIDRDRSSTSTCRRRCRYGRGSVEQSNLTTRQVSSRIFILLSRPSYKTRQLRRLRRVVASDDVDHAASGGESATEGSGLVASAILDGRAGVWFIIRLTIHGESLSGFKSHRIGSGRLRPSRSSTPAGFAFRHHPAEGDLVPAQAEP